MTIEDTVALNAQDKRRFQPNQNSRENNSHKNTNQQNNVTNNSQVDQNQIFCTYCKRNNHHWKECRKLKADNERKKKYAQEKRQETTNKPGEKTYSGAFTASALLSSSVNNNQLWIVDSGASNHMSPNKQQLSNYKEFEIPRQITLADGGETPAYGEGDLHFTSENFVGKLEAVLYVPKIAENLFSIPKALARGNEVKFLKDSQTVLFLKQNQIKLRGYLSERGLFTLNLKPDEMPKEVANTSLETWHKRFGHSSIEAVKQLISKNAVTGLTVKPDKKTNCQDCIMSKICKCSHPLRREVQASETAAVLNFDTCGPFPVMSLGHAKYFVLATEDYSDYKYIDVIASKSQARESVKEIINKAELDSKRTVKSIVSDNGSEYSNRDLQEWLRQRGVVHSTSSSYTPQQNGRAERANRTVIEGIRTLLECSKLPQELWAEAANFMVYTTNRMIAPRNTDKTRYELFLSKKPNVGNLRYFGQRAIAKKRETHREGKLSPKGEECRLVGYTERYNTYRLYTDKPVQDVFVSCDVVFLENDQKSTSTREENDNYVVLKLNQTTSQEGARQQDNCSGSYSPNEDTTDLYDSANSIHSALTEEESDDATEVDYASRVERPHTRNYSKTLNSDSNKEVALFTLNNEPRTLQDAIESKEWPLWKKAIEDELVALNHNNTWTLVPRPKDRKIVKNKWVFKLKLDSQGNIERYKARLVAKGYSQIANVDYRETYAPVAALTTIRIFFALITHNDLHVQQFDISTAFLYGDLEEEIYMELPQGSAKQETDLVCKLNKSLYGLKQAPRQWNKKFDEFLKKFSLEQSELDKCLYFNENRTLLLILYVDDGIIASKDRRKLNQLMEHLNQNFKLKMLECQSFLGLEIHQNHNEGTLTITQAQYAKNILQKFGMSDCHQSSTPEEAQTEQNSEGLTEDYPFKELLGSLQYLVTCTRPDIAHAVNIVSRTSKPTMANWLQLKRILRYIQGTTNLGLRFKRENKPILIGYSDADFANDTQTRRSTSGACIMFGNTPVYWRCQRQSIITLSSTEAEYIAACELVKELIPIRRILQELGQIQNEPTQVLIDNQSTIKIANSEESTARTKHIDLRHKWINEQVENKNIEIKYIASKDQAADILTKPLQKGKFVYNRAKLLVAFTACIAVANGFTFEKSNPLFFRPTDFQFFDGDTEFKIRLVSLNPCHHFFDRFSEISGDNMKLTLDCLAEYQTKISSILTKCHGLDSIGKNLTFVEPTYGCSVTGQNCQELSRPKRFVPLLMFTGIIVLVGLAASSAITSKDLETNQQTFADSHERQRTLLDDSSKLLQSMRDDIQELSY